MATVLTVAAAWFKVRKTWLTPQQSAAVAAWYDAKWSIIHNARLPELPQAVLEWTWTALDKAPAFAERIVDTSWGTGRLRHILYRLQEWAIWPVGLLYFVIGFAGILRGMHPNGEVWGLAVFMTVGAVGITFLLALLTDWAYGELILASWFLGITVASAVGLMFWASQATPSVALFLLCLVSYAWFETWSIVIDAWLESKRRVFSLLTVSVSIGFVATPAAILLGHVIVPSSPVPSTLRMLVANVICDALAVTATVRLLRAARFSAQRRVRVIVFVAGMLSIGSVFACAAVWLGAWPIPWYQVGGYFVGLSPQGDWELGPYFWVMHTTFLPSVMYVVALVVCACVKVIVIPVARVLKRGATHTDPHGLTAETLGFFAVTLAGIAALAKLALP